MSADLLRIPVTLGALEDQHRNFATRIEIIATFNGGGQNVPGHASLREIARYTRAADQVRLAVSAMHKTETPGVKPEPRFDNARKKA